MNEIWIYFHFSVSFSTLIFVNNDIIKLQRANNNLRLECC